MDPKLFGNKEHRKKFTDDIKLIKESYLPIITKLLPIYNASSSWVQLLSSHHIITISLVRVAIQKFKSILDDLLITEAGKGISPSSTLEKENIDAAYDILKALQENFGERFDRYINNPIYNIASFLDLRTMTYSNLDTIKQDIMAKFPNLIPIEPVVNTINNNLSPLQIFLNRNSAASSDLLMEEINEHIKNRLDYDKFRAEFIIGKSVKDIEEFDIGTSQELDPLYYWPQQQQASKLKLLSKVALIILGIQPSQSSVEELFSITGNLCKSRNAALLGKNVNQVASMHYWLIDELDYDHTKKEENRIEKNRRFVRYQTQQYDTDDNIIMGLEIDSINISTNIFEQDEQNIGEDPNITAHNITNLMNSYEPDYELDYEQAYNPEYDQPYEFNELTELTESQLEERLDEITGKRKIESISSNNNNNNEH